MQSRLPLFRSAAIVSLGQVVSYGCGFVRNIILARILTKADFGVAAAFGTALSLLEIAGRMSLGQQLVQSRNPTLDALQSTCHGILLIAGFASAILLLLSAGPLAHAFDVAHLTWAFAILAIIPVLKGAEHLDYWRATRDLRFIPSALCETIPQVVITLAAWPLSLLVSDFRLILTLLISKSLLATILTHLLADRRYRVQIQRAFFAGIIKFSGPLLLNGLLLFASQQGDQFVVGAVLTLEDLATYAVAFSLISIPWFITAQVSSSLILPILARCQEEHSRFRDAYRACVDASGVAASLIMAPLIVAGGHVIALIYGSRYGDAGAITATLGSACAIRFIRLAPAIAALARADTLNQLYSNIARSITIPLAIGASLFSKDLVVIASATVIGELIATGVSVSRLMKLHQIRIAEHGRSALLVGLSVSCALLVRYAVSGSPVWEATGAALILAGAVGIGVRFILPDTFRQSQSATSELLNRVTARLASRKEP